MTLLTLLKATSGGGGMPVGYRSSSTGSTDTQSATHTAPVPTGAASDDIALLALYMWLDTSTDPVVTWPSGFTQTVFYESTADPFQRMAVAWKRLTAADTGNYTITLNASYWGRAQCILVTGAATTGDPIEATNTTEAGGTTMPSTSVTTVTAPFLAHFVTKVNAATNTPPTSFTEVQDTDYITTSYRIPGTTGTHTTSGGSTSASTVKTASLVAVKAAGGAATVTGVAVGAFGFTGTAAGVDRVLGVAAVAFGFTGTASGIPKTSGQAVASLGFTATAAGIDRAIGVAVAPFGFTATAAGVDRALGVAVAAFGFTGTALGVTGTPPVTGVGSGLFGFTATAQGQPRTSGIAVASFGFTATAAGRRSVVSVVAASFGFTATSAGKRSTLGTAQALLGFTATVIGTVIPPVVYGTAHGATGSAPTARAASGQAATATSAAMAVPTATGG